MSEWAYQESVYGGKDRKSFSHRLLKDPEQFLQPQLWPSGGLHVKCRLKTLFFSDPDENVLYYPCTR